MITKIGKKALDTSDNKSQPMALPLTASTIGALSAYSAANALYPHWNTVRYGAPAAGVIAGLGLSEYLGRSSGSKNTSDQDLLTPSAEAVLGGSGVWYGRKSINSAYHGGDLTGRQTLYHGVAPTKPLTFLGEEIPGTAISAQDKVDNILQEGIKPSYGLDRGRVAELLEDPERFEKALNKTYTTDSYINALGYANKDPKAVVKINAPTWKMDVVKNPETDMPFNEWVNRSYKDGMSGARKAFSNPITANGLLGLEDSVVVDGKISPRYIPKSKKYQQNNLKEIREYIAANKGRFAKGVGKTIGGIGLTGLGAYSLYDVIDKVYNGQKA